MFVVNHHLILFIHNFIFGLGLGLDLKKLASASALISKLCPRPQGPGLGLGLGLEVLASFNITAYHSIQVLTRQHVVRSQTHNLLITSPTP